MKYSLIILLLFIFSLTSCQNDNAAQENTIENLSIKLENDPQNIDLLEKRKTLYLQQNQTDKAIADLQQCINISPNDSKYYIELSDLFMKEGKVNNTLALLEKASKVDPNNSTVWVKVSEIYLLYKKYNEVIKFANKALEVDQYNDNAFFVKAYAFKEMGNTEAAINNFQECLKNNPNNYSANIELGAIYSQLNNDLAIISYNNAIAIDSSNISAFYNLGLFYQNNDKLNEAIGTYNTIIEMDSLFPYSYYNIGYIYLELLKLFLYKKYSRQN